MSNGVFYMQISMKACEKLILRFFDTKSLQYLLNEFWDEVDFLDANKYQSFLQVDFHTLDIKALHKFIGIYHQFGVH